MGIFDERYWLPRNTSWSDMPTDARDLFYPIYFVFPMVALRIIWEAFVGIPAAHILGYGEGKLGERIIGHLFGGFAVNTRQKRILECFSRFTFYTLAFSIGFIIMYQKSWLWDVKDCWIGYPQHTIDNDIWWYYMIEMTFYYSLLVLSVFDVRRSDYWELIFHHIVTIGLLSLSFAINFVRVGTLVLLSHDVADILLEGGKLVKYDKSRVKETNVIFVIFLIVWILTRLGYFPFTVIRSAVFEAAGLIQPDYEIFSMTQEPYAPRITIIMMCCLVLLHVFWTVIIARIVYKTAKDGEAADIRSEDEMSGTEYSHKNDQKDRKKVLTKKRPQKQD